MKKAPFFLGLSQVTQKFQHKRLSSYSCAERSEQCQTMGTQDNVQYILILWQRSTDGWSDLHKHHPVAKSWPELIFSGFSFKEPWPISMGDPTVKETRLETAVVFQMSHWFSLWSVCTIITASLTICITQGFTEPESLWLL